MNVLFDTNIFLDFFIDREPFSSEAEKLITMAGNGIFNGYVTANALTDIYFVSRKTLSAYDVKRSLGYIMELFQVIPVFGGDCKAAINSENPDFEDALMEVCAQRSKMDFIVSRDQHFLKNCTLAITPATFLEKFYGGEKL